jgi:hypothetical protein
MKSLISIILGGLCLASCVPLRSYQPPAACLGREDTSIILEHSPGGDPRLLNAGIIISEQAVVYRQPELREPIQVAIQDILFRLADPEPIPNVEVYSMASDLISRANAETGRMVAVAGVLLNEFMAPGILNDCDRALLIRGLQKQWLALETRGFYQ